MNRKNKKEKMTQDSKLIRVTLVMSIFTLLLSSYTFYSHIQSVEYSESLWNGNQAINKRSAENRRALNRILECQANEASCEQIDWDRPYHTMRDVSTNREVKD